MESPWDLEPTQPPLRTLSIEPNLDPRNGQPSALKLKYGRTTLELSTTMGTPLLINLKAILERYDPDLILTAWGDSWLLPYLLQRSQELHISLPLNRDATHSLVFHKERSYFSYGQVVYRGEQVQLFGRWHVDVYNAVMFHDYGMEGIWELARVTSLPVQTVARVSPGTGISAMQMVTALRNNILIPWHKQQAEYEKTALDLLNSDRGGLVYLPTAGLHHDVAEIDFISMYPSIMTRFNISPETVLWKQPETIQAEGKDVLQEEPGLIPLTLKPLLEKRVELKHRLAGLSRWDMRYSVYKARITAHKWLLVTCFGYLGYKNARFGRIEAHEAVTAYGREALLRAKEAAEDMGYTVLHMYVDGLWIYQKEKNTVADIQPLLEEIVCRTGLPISLDGIYRWLVFMPSRINPHVSVANRYFGVFQDGTLKMRGIETRRQDTPPFIVETQMEILKLLSQSKSGSELSETLPQAIAIFRQRMKDLKNRIIPMEKLVITLRVSRELQEYRTLSPAARALSQLQDVGKTLKPGQSIRFVYTLGKPDVHAWGLPDALPYQRIDIPRYVDLLSRAAKTILEPLCKGLGLSEQLLSGSEYYQADWFEELGIG
jgi:DNA polymerase-2